MPPKHVLPMHTNSITQPLHTVHTSHVSTTFSVSIYCVRAGLTSHHAVCTLQRGWILHHVGSVPHKQTGTLRYLHKDCAPSSFKQVRFVIPALTCPTRQSILHLSRTVKHLRTVHVQLFPCCTDGLHCRMVAAINKYQTRSNGWVGGPRKTVSTMDKTYVFGKTSVL